MTGAEQTPPREAGRVLLIEDEPAVARLTELVLSSEGYQVDHLSEHTTAAAHLSSQRYDIVLADTDMGARTAGLAGLLPLVEAAAPTPVLLFTAHRFPSAEIAAAGLAGAVRKPYDIDDLLQTIRQTIDGDGAARADSDGAIASRDRTGELLCS